MVWIWRRRKISFIIMSITSPQVPIGISIAGWLKKKCCPRLQINRPLLHKITILVLTYIAYTCYHMTRKPISVVKSVLHQNCSAIERPDNVIVTDDNEQTWCDYPPFDQPDAKARLAVLDSAFLFAYAIAMFASGFIAERVSLRYFLTLGMLFSGIFCYAFGLARTYDIHSMGYFILVQAIAGVCQTTGWPGVVTLVGRWFGKSKRGLIFGIWNSHTSIGNIVGTLIASYYVEKDWSMSFIVPGFIMGGLGFVIFLFLVESPEIVGLTEDGAEASGERRNSYRRMESGGNDSGESEVDENVGEQGNPSIRSLRGSVNSEVSVRVNERTPILSNVSVNHNNSSSANKEAVGFTKALAIPGVVEFSLCLFFSKLVSYTFLYWLPFYIQSSTTMGATRSADLSTLFDFGGIVGAIAAGALSDHTGMSATTCSVMLAIAAPMLLVYQHWGTLSLPINVMLLFVVGILVNGPYALITTSVSAELGTHSSLQGNAKALATVTAIIDGTGSIGAAIGPLLAGLVSSSGWQNVFFMLITSDIIALLLLTRLVRGEISRYRRRLIRIE